MANIVQNRDIQMVIQLVASSRAEIERIPGVVGTGITHSNVTGIDTETAPGYQLIVYLEDESPIPYLPSEINGIRVVYKVTGKVIALQDRNQYRPIKTGSEIANTALLPPGGGCWVGTLGGFPKASDGRTVILSNNHVIGYNILGLSAGHVGDPIYQPGCVTTSIGRLEKWIKINSTGNTVDAAYASINSGISIDPSTLCNNTVGSSVEPQIGMSVSKYGRTTMCTRGRIEAVNVNIDVGYPEAGGNANFNGQFAVSNPFGAGGDSGSLVTTDDSNHNAVGLLFAGSSTTTYCNRIIDVEQLLGVSFGGTGGTLPPTPPPGGECVSGSMPVFGTCVKKTYLMLAGLGFVGILILKS